ncbi:helix-turn-helix domain-containing protein [Desulfobacterium sp. N47]|uniref:helix-turn-helix domain-containing protein n=1 Tax=Desulfobacterium sp. N47 TaxID=3115210 RepID=UPI003C85A33C
MNVQIIEKNGKPEWAVIPYDEYQKLNEALEDAEDINDIEKNLKAIQEGKEITIPGEITFAILDGINPIRAWREHKMIKMNELAKKVGISSAYLSQIENGKRNPTIDTLKAIARELRVEIEVLI